MAIEVVMPKFGVIMTQGTLVQWLKQPGDPVQKGEPILTIETEKAVMEIEAPASGVLGPLLAEPGMTVPVGDVIGHILTPGEQIPPTEDLAVVVRQDSEVRASPAARRMAHECGVELSKVVGSGPGGRIVKADVEACLQRGQTSAAADEIGLTWSAVEPTHVRELTGQRMAESFQAVPHFYLTVEIDMSQAVVLRQSLLSELEQLDENGLQISFTDLLVKACADGLRRNPTLNGTYAEGQIRIFDQINIGVAVDTADGLLVPVVRDADRRSLRQICKTRQELADKARNRALTPDEVSGGTFTLSNLGMFGVDIFSAIINPPQAAILAAGSITERPTIVNGAVVARPCMWVTLSVDHRVVDGAAGARFLQDLRDVLEQPYLLLR